MVRGSTAFRFTVVLLWVCCDVRFVLDAGMPPSIPVWDLVEAFMVWQFGSVIPVRRFRRGPAGSIRPTARRECPPWGVRLSGRRVGVRTYQQLWTRCGGRGWRTAVPRRPGEHCSQIGRAHV